MTLEHPALKCRSFKARQSSHTRCLHKTTGFVALLAVEPRTATRQVCSQVAIKKWQVHGCALPQGISHRVTRTTPRSIPVDCRSGSRRHRLASHACTKRILLYSFCRRWADCLLLGWAWRSHGRIPDGVPEKRHLAVRYQGQKLGRSGNETQQVVPALFRDGSGDLCAKLARREEEQNGMTEQQEGRRHRFGQWGAGRKSRVLFCGRDVYARSSRVPRSCNFSSLSLISSLCVLSIRCVP